MTATFLLATRPATHLRFGCLVVSFAGPDTCGVRATAENMTYMAGQSAAQCGPCVFGLAAIAEATNRLAVGFPITSPGTIPGHLLDHARRPVMAPIQVAAVAR